MLGLLESFSALTPARHQSFLLKLSQLKTTLIQLLGSNIPNADSSSSFDPNHPVCIIYPAFPTLPPKHDHLLLDPLSCGYYCSIWNALELPVTSIPLGLYPASCLP